MNQSQCEGHATVDELRKAIGILYGDAIASMVIDLWDNRDIEHSDDYRVGWMCGAASALLTVMRTGKESTDANQILGAG